MEVQLSAEQEAFIREAVASGRFRHAEDAVKEALLLWEERERKRLQLLAQIDDADASLARGAGRPISAESMEQLASEIKERGRARVPGDPQANRQ